MITSVNVKQLVSGVALGGEPLGFPGARRASRVSRRSGRRQARRRSSSSKEARKDEALGSGDRLAFARAEVPMANAGHEAAEGSPRQARPRRETGRDRRRARRFEAFPQAEQAPLEAR